MTFGHVVSMAAAGAGHGLKHGLALPPPAPLACGVTEGARPGIQEGAGMQGECENTGSVREYRECVQNRGTRRRHGGSGQLSANATAEIDELYSPV